LSELGRFLVTKQANDIGAFKTPALRNVAITGPYMHDGSMQTLWDVLDHYNKGGVPNPNLDGGMQRLGLTEAEIDDMVAFLDTLGFGYVIRFRGNIHVTAADGQSKPAAEWVGKGGRARTLRDARVTAKGQPVGAVVCVHAKGMKQPWCLASSARDAPATMLIRHYAKRWTIEPQFRDTKDLQFGMGLSATRIGEPMRRDRLLLISAFATALLTLLGAVGERLGLDRLLKSNTSTTRTHSLFRQGCMLYELIPNMPEHRLAPLLQAFNAAVANTDAFTTALALANEGMGEVTTINFRVFC